MSSIVIKEFDESDPNWIFEELTSNFSTLQGRKVERVYCPVLTPSIFQAIIPAIYLAAQGIFITLLPSPMNAVEQSVNNDLQNNMLRYLSDAKTGRQFAFELGYSDAKNITLYNFVRDSLGGLNPGFNWCQNALTIHLFAADLNMIVVTLGTFSLLSSTFTGLLNTCAPLVINKIFPTDLPEIEYNKTRNLLDRIDTVLKNKDIQLSQNQISTLEKNQKSLKRSHHRVWIVFGVGSALLLFDFGMKFLLVNMGLQQINAKTDPQILYQPGLPDFCLPNLQCNLTLQPANPNQCRGVYPSDFFDYAKENSSLNEPTNEFGIWKIWTAVMLPFAGRFLETIPLIYRTTKEAIDRCRFAKEKHITLINEMEEVL
jgi:hypothetical protein